MLSWSLLSLLLSIYSGTGDGPFTSYFKDVLSVLVELIISISLLYGPISNSVVP